MNLLFDDHIEVLNLLVKYEVKFLLIGGYAVNYYGYTRTTGDMDLWIEPSNENKTNIILALANLELDPDDLVELGKEDFTQHVVFSIGIMPQKVDFITKVNFVEFSEAYSNARDVEMDGIHFKIVQYRDLVLMKFNTGRLKDKDDIEKLQNINQNRND